MKCPHCNVEVVEGRQIKERFVCMKCKRVYHRKALEHVSPQNN